MKSVTYELEAVKRQEPFFDLSELILHLPERNIFNVVKWRKCKAVYGTRLFGSGVIYGILFHVTWNLKRAKYFLQDWPAVLIKDDGMNMFSRIVSEDVHLAEEM